MIKWWTALCLTPLLSVHAQEPNKKWGLSEENAAQLKRDKILITGKSYDQIDDAYGPAEIFITTDTVIAAWNALLQQSLKALDERFSRQLPGDLDQILESLTASRENDTRRKPALKKATLIMGVASKLAGGKWSGGAELDALIAAEAKRIEAASGDIAPPWLTEGEKEPLPINYAIFKPVAAYTESEFTGRYFRTVKWLQEASLDQDVADNAATLALIREASKSSRAFEGILEVAEALVGLGNPKDMRQTVIPRVQTPDVALFETTTRPQRPFPNPLEAMALAGMPLAETLLAEDNLTAAIKACREAAEEGDIPIFWRYMKGLALLSDNSDPDLPPFMKAEPWRRKCLNTGMSGWVQISHTVTLSRSITLGPFGMSEPNKKPRSFVEPNPEFYRYFGRLTSRAIAVLQRQEKRSEFPKEGAISYIRDFPIYSWLRLRDICQELEGLSHKQLRGLELSPADEEFMKNYGTALEKILDVEIGERENSPQVMTAYSRPGTGMLLAGIGRPRQILVLYPWKGQEMLCHGAVMPFYSTQAKAPLTDAEWKARLAGPDAPKPPEWLVPILAK